MRRSSISAAIAAAAAGAVNGLFGAGGGMVLIPLLTALTDIEDREVFPASIAIILPMCVVSLVIGASDGPLPWDSAFPYLIGSAVGGVLAGLLGQKIPTLWLHRVLGVLILYGGWRYLC